MMETSRVGLAGGGGMFKRVLREILLTTLANPCGKLWLFRAITLNYQATRLWMGGEASSRK